MGTKILAGSSLALGLALGALGVVLLSDGTTQAVQLAQGAAELTGATADVLATKLVESGAQGAVTCKRGVLSNMPEVTYCTDGKTAGFVLDVKTEADLTTEVDEKLGGLVADALTIQADESGRVYVSVEGVVTK